jgi:Cu/Ag efflux protein CusF
MTIAKSICAAAALAFIASAAFAQDAKTGMVTQIDRLNGTIAIQQPQDGTVGASGGGIVKQYKVQGTSLDALHAGDQVSFTATQSGDAITKIEKKK